jgi:outer membrane receptor protein involved in Fe transport
MKWRLSSHVARALERSDVTVDGLVSYRALLAALLDPNPATAFNAFGDGSHTSKATLAGIAASATFDGHTTLDTVGVAADGPVFQLPAGPAKLALGAEYRHQTFSALTISPDVSTNKARLARDVHAAYAELRLPLLSRDHGSQELTLSLATRFENHLNLARSTAPKAGLTWSPATGISLQGTWTTAFRAPNLADLYEGNNSSMIIALPDPHSPTMISRVLAWGDKNADLHPESSHGWTLGFELGSPLLTNGSFALTYFDILLRNQFADYSLSLDALMDPGQTERVNRAPTAEERSEVCGRSHFVGLAAECLASPIDAILDARVLNNAYLATSGIDLITKQSFESPAGHFDLRLEGAYVTRYAVRDTPTSPLLNLVDTQNHVLRLRTRGALNWQRASLGATAGINFDGGYKDVASKPQRSVGSWTTWDLQVRRDTTLGFGGVPLKSRIALNIQNVFDTPPPFLNNALGLGYDAENADLLGRVISFQLTTTW